LRTVMSSIIRRRRGLISAIGAPVCGSGFDNHNPVRQETFLTTAALPPAEAG
jgi:hypothetical protein